MSLLQEAIVMGVGVLFAIAGIVLFTYFRVKGTRGAINKIKIFGVEFQVSAPSLVIFVIGTALIVFPFFVGEAPPSFSFTEELRDIVPAIGPSSYDRFVTIQDDTGTIQVDVPTVWSEVSGLAWEFSGEMVGPALSAAADLDRYYNTWSEPGVFFGASSILAARIDVDSLLNQIDLSSDCDFDGRYDYEDPAYTGKYDLWLNCGGTGTAFLVLAAVPPDRSFITYVQIQVVSEADLNALDTILETFFVLDSFWETWGP